MESLSWPPSSKDSQKDASMYDPQFQLDSPSTTEGLVHIKAGPENSRRSLKNFANTSINHSLHCFDGKTSNKSFSGLNPHIVAMPVNSKSISTVKVFQSDRNLRRNNISESAQQSKSAKQPGSSWASAATSFSNLTNLQRIEHGLSCTPNKLQYCLQSEKSSSFLDSHSSIISTDAEQKSTLFENDTPFVQSDVIQEVGTTGSTRACELHDLPNEIWGETATGAMKPVIKGANKNNGFLEMNDWWDDTSLLEGNASHLSGTTMNSVSVQASSDPLSVEERGLFSESFFDELLGFDGNAGPVLDSTEPLIGFVSGCHLPSYNLQDSFSVCKAQVPPLILPSSSCTSENVPIISSKTPMPLQNLSMDSCGSLNIANSMVSQVKKLEGENVVKKRARPGESTRPRPKDRQQIQERVKELREIVPNSAKVRIDRNISLCV